MKKFIIILFVLLPALNVCGQEFLNNDNYIYGEGIGVTQKEADDNALLAFARTLCTQITSIATHITKEENSVVNEYFKKDIRIDNSMIGTDLLQHILIEDNYFRVYRYINKQQYIDKCLKEYNAQLDKIPVYCKTGGPHVYNFIMGAYYLAYKALDNAIMDVINPANLEMKVDMKKRAEEYYHKFAKIDFLDGTKRTIITTTSGTSGLYGFQYSFFEDFWEVPNCFFVNKKEMWKASPIPKNEIFECCRVRDTRWSIGIRIRCTYEVPLKNNEVCILNVPDDWYFYIHKM